MYMEDLAFGIPKKILKLAGLVLCTVGVLIYVVTGNPKQAVDFFVNGTGTVTTPIVNKGIKIMEKVLKVSDEIVKKNR